MIENTPVAKHTPEWLEEIATRLQQSDTLGADGVAYALEWAAWDIRLMEKRIITVIEVSAATIVGLKAEIARLDAEVVRWKKLAHEAGENVEKPKRAWS
jgi:uncharacterized small protein (DUF1192 family)